MLNLWRKIHEKGLPTSPKKNVTSLDPRYDGPLRFFDAELAANAVPLEKGRLTLVFEDLFDCKMAYPYFKHFVQTRMESEIFYIWNTVAKKTDSDKIFKWAEDDTEENRATDTELTDFHVKFLDEMRSKIIKGENLAFDYCDASSLRLLLQRLLSYLWREFLRSEWYCRYQIDLLTSRMVTLGDILKHETALSYFMQFLEIEGCQTIVEFWLAASNFQQLVENHTKMGDVDDSQILDDAINIYENTNQALNFAPIDSDSSGCDCGEDEIRNAFFLFILIFIIIYYV